MQYKRLGNTGVKVTPVCLGAMGFGAGMNEEESIRATHEAIDRGINFIDTADSYGRGISEDYLGKALTPEKRINVVLATKLWVKMYDQPNAGGCSRRHILRAIEDNLKRLRTDWIDLLQLHHPDPDTPVEETLSTLDLLVKSGKVRYIGVSNHYAWQMAHMLGVSALNGWEPIVSAQVRYSILDRAVEVETIPFCKRFNMAMLTYSPVAGGILTGKYKRGEEPAEGTRLSKAKSLARELTEDTFDCVDVVRAMAQDYGTSMQALATAWVMSKPYVTAPIVGASRPEHFQTMYDAMELLPKLKEEDIGKIDEASVFAIYKPFQNQPISQGYQPSPHRL